MALKGASALHKAPPRFGQIMFALFAWDALHSSMSVLRNKLHPWQRHLHGLDTILLWVYRWLWGPPELVGRTLQALLYLLRSKLKWQITCWTLFLSSSCTKMLLLLGSELRNTGDLSKGVNHLKLFGNKTWSSAHLQNVLADHHLVVVKNSHGKLPGYRMCQGMLLLFLGGLWSEARADALLGSAQQRDVLGPWFSCHHQASFVVVFTSDLLWYITTMSGFAQRSAMSQH